MPAPIIVVHDDADTCAAAIAAVRAAGFNAVGIRDPMTALDIVEADTRARVLVTRIDFGQGALNGVALARMIRLKQPHIRVVFLALPEYRDLADDLGLFLPMPLDLQALVEAVSRLLAEVG